jgi:hypothetical protein
MKQAWVVLSTTAVIAVAGCNHSPPFPTGPFVGDGSFDQVEPIRLTFSPGVDHWPSFSDDGRWISYRFARGTFDRDYCAGLLPAEGGQRFEEICAWELGEDNRSDDFRALTRVGDDRMAFTRHSSGIGNASPSDAGLYLGPLSGEREAVKVLALFTRPAGASGVWAYLIDPVWTGGEELLVLASNVFIGQTVAFGPIDTVYQGVEIARINLGGNSATVTPVAPAIDAVAWARDQTTGQLYYHRRYYSAPPGSGPTNVVADTVFRVAASGGTAEVVYGRPAVPGSIAEGMDGFTLLDGRLMLSLYDMRQPAGVPSPPPETRSRLLRIEGDGTVTTVNTMLTSNGSRWTRLSASADGRHLVAERILAGQRDLYLFDIAP